MLHSFTVRSILGAREVIFNMSDFPSILISTTTGFERRVVEHVVHVRHGILEEHLLASAKAWSEGAGHVQDCFPYLGPDDREFLVSGTTPAEWDRLFGQPWEE